MRIERGHDTHVTTIGKLRKVLPGLPGAAQDGGTGTMGIELNDMAARIGHLVQGFTSQERLHKVRAFVLAQLQEEHNEILSPAVAASLDAKQRDAERGLVARRSSTKRRRKVNGKDKTDGSGGQH